MEAGKTLACASSVVIVIRVSHIFMKLLLASLLAGVPILVSAAEVRVVRFDESIPFRMGEVTSRRIIHPGLGAKKTTLNFSISTPGSEFAQHVHDYSDDTILVLQGEVNLKQGDSLHLFKAGECAFVPTGQIHGTVTAGTGEAVMIRPGAVKYVDYGKTEGAFTSPKIGSNRATGVHRTLRKNEKFTAKVAENGEGLLFVWRGAIRVTDGKGNWRAGERDTVFTQGGATLDVVGDADGTTEVIEVAAPEVR
jgi:quercetin dioxygenase-like cupin family protein